MALPSFPPCTVLPELRPEDADDELLRFACYVAVCYTVYGASYDSLTTEHILGLVSQLRPDMVKQLKTDGSGKLPDIQKRKTEHLAPHRPMMPLPPSASPPGIPPRSAMLKSWTTCVRCWSSRSSPRSYPSSFADRKKIYLPIPGLPKKGVHQLFCLCGAVPPASMSGWRIMLGWPCRKMSGIKTFPMRTAPCPAPLRCSLWGWRGRIGGRWCVIIWTVATMSTPPLQEKFLHALIQSTGLLPSPCRCWSTASSPCRI